MLPIILCASFLLVAVQGQLPVCADIMMLLDTSCSVSMGNRQRGIDFMKDMADALKLTMIDDAPSVCYAAATFNNETEHGFYFNNEYETLEEIKQRFETVKLEPMGCRTYTYDGLDKAQDDYFVEENGDRNDTAFPNILIVWSDGRTFPLRLIDQTIARAQELKDAGVTIYYVVVECDRFENGVRKEPTGEEQEIPTSPAHLYDIRNVDEDEADDILSNMFFQITFENQCVSSDDPFNGCLDIVFALDTSCSIDLVDRATYIQLVKDVALLLDFTTNSVGVVLFDFDSRYEDGGIILGSHDNPIDFNAAVDRLNTTSVDCKTRTDRLFEYIESDIFNDAGGDRVVNADVLIMVYDGMTSPLHYRTDVIDKAGGLKDAGLTISMVEMINNRGKNDIAQEELNDIPTPDTDFVDYRHKLSDALLVQQLNVMLSSVQSNNNCQ